MMPALCWFTYFLVKIHLCILITIGQYACLASACQTILHVQLHLKILASVVTMLCFSMLFLWASFAQKLQNMVL